MDGIAKTITDLSKWFSEHPFIGGVISLIASALITILLVTIMIKIIHRLFKKREDKKGSHIIARYVENIVCGTLIVLSVFWVLLGNRLTASFGDVIFKGSAVLGAIIGFAAQPVISDLIGGLLLSLSKAFQIGDRLELEDGTNGVIKDITFRHVVLLSIDRRRIIIPNSKLNKMRISNTSREQRHNSFLLKVNVAYGSDLELAMQVLEQIVEECPYTIPGQESPGGMSYSPSYFLEFGDSALVLAISVYYPPIYRTEIVRSDINLRVNREFNKHHIEIPFSYVNVLLKDQEQMTEITEKVLTLNQRSFEKMEKTKQEE